MSFIISLFFSLIIFSDYAHAAAAVQKQQQMKAAQQQAQQQAEQQYAQQVLAQQQAAQQQAVAQYQAAQQQAAQQQAIAQYQAQQVAVAQYQAAQVAAVQKQLAQQVIQQQINAQIVGFSQQAQLVAAQQNALKQEVMQEIIAVVTQQIKAGVKVNIQDQMIAQAMSVAIQRLGYQKAMVQQQVNQQQAVQQQAAMVASALADRQGYDVAQEQVYVSSQRMPTNTRPYEALGNAPVKDIVDIAEVWAKLERNSKAWVLLIDNQAKVMTVNEFIERFRKDGIKIQKPPVFYAQMIDDMIAQNHEMILKPFREIIQILAVMEYDFDNGSDRDLLARQLLGAQFYEANKKRLGR